jgi:hypothetical protein
LPSVPVVTFWLLACRLPSSPADDRPANDAPSSGTESCAHSSLWACPSSLEEPCEAWWWVELEQNAALADDAWGVARRVREIVDAAVPAGCLRGCEPKNPEWSCLAALCTLDDLLVEYRREWFEEKYDGHKGTAARSSEEVRAHFRATKGPWSRLDFESTLASNEHDYSATADATWQGHIDPSLPDDGTFQYEVDSSSNDHAASNAQTWTSAGCRVAVGDWGGFGSDHDYEFVFPRSTLDVVRILTPGSCSNPTQATLDGVTYEVRDDDWRIIGLDLDGDGFSVEGGDCADDDPERSPCEGC